MCRTNSSTTHLHGKSRTTRSGTHRVCLPSAAIIGYASTHARLLSTFLGTAERRPVKSFHEESYAAGCSLPTAATFLLCSPRTCETVLAFNAFSRSSKTDDNTGTRNDANPGNNASTPADLDWIPGAARSLHIWTEPSKFGPSLLPK